LSALRHWLYNSDSCGGEEAWELSEGPHKLSTSVKLGFLHFLPLLPLLSCSLEVNSKTVNPSQRVVRTSWMVKLPIVRNYLYRVTQRKNCGYTPVPWVGYEWSHSMCLRPHGHYLHLAPQLKMELYLLHVDSKECGFDYCRGQEVFFSSAFGSVLEST
jgi:hypothetical protein